MDNHVINFIPLNLIFAYVINIRLFAHFLSRESRIFITLLIPELIHGLSRSRIVIVFVGIHSRANSKYFSVTFKCNTLSDCILSYMIIAKTRSQQVVLSLLCVQYHPLLRKAEFTKITEKYHMALDQ